MREARAPLLDGYIVLQEGANDHRIRAILGYDGPIDPRRLRSALLASFDAVPLLAAAYRGHGSRGRWSAMSDTNEAGLDRSFRLVAAPDAQAAKAALEEALAWIPAEATGPQVGLTLVTCTGQDSLCLVVNHAVMDGSGFKDYLALLARLYNGGPGLQARADRGSGGRDVYAVLGRGGAALPRGSRPSAAGTAAWPVLKPSSPPEPRGGPRLFRWQGKLSALDRARAKLAAAQAAPGAGRATVNDVLMAAACAAIAEALPEPKGHPIEVAFMVDMRRYDQEGILSPYCNASSTEALLVDPWSFPLGGLVAEVAVQTAAIKAGQPGLGGLRRLKAASALLPTPLFEAILRRRIRASVLSTTNLGRLEPGRLDLGGAKAVEACLVTALKEDPALQFSFSTFGDSLSITSYGRWTGANEARVAAIYASLAAILARD
jgi:NRPS condensation-like uncharacterized protein